MKSLSSFLLLISIVSFADDGAVYVKKDELVPFEGILLPTTQAQDMRKSLLDLDYATKHNDNLNLELQDYKARLVNFQTENDKLSQRLESGNSFWERTGYFVLGAAAATFVSFGVVKTLK